MLIIDTEQINKIIALHQEYALTTHSITHKAAARHLFFAIL